MLIIAISTEVPLTTFDIVLKDFTHPSVYVLIGQQPYHPSRWRVLQSSCHKDKILIRQNIITVRIQDSIGLDFWCMFLDYVTKVIMSISYDRFRLWSLGKSMNRVHNYMSYQYWFHKCHYEAKPQNKTSSLNSKWFPSLNLNEYTCS